LFAISNLVAIGCIQGGVISSYLLFKSSAARWLGLFLILITANMCVAFYLNGGLFKPEMTWVALWNSVNTYWLLGPLLLAFVIAITQPDQKFRAKDLLHFLPFGINLLSALLFWLTQHSSTHMHYLNELTQLADMPLIKRFSLPFLLPAIHFTMYLIAASWLSLKYWKESETRKAIPQISWICLALTISYLMMLAMLSVLVVALVLDIPPSPSLFAIANLTTVAGLFSVSFLLARLGPPELNNNQVLKSIEKLPNKAHSIIKQDVTAKQQNQLDNLEKLMSREEYFKDPALTQLKLAEHMGISRHKLSALLSIHASGSFYDFLNSFRVAAIKAEIINQPTNVNLLNLAYECGFNSKSSFNKAFKKFEGLTPSQYRKLVKGRFQI